MIRANQPVQLGARMARVEFTDRVDAVADAATVNFHRRDLVSRFPGQRETEQTRAEGGRGGGDAGLERGLGGGNEDQPVERQFLHGRAGHQEMAAVDGIKGTAVKAEPHADQGSAANGAGKWNPPMLWAR